MSGAMWKIAMLAASLLIIPLAVPALFAAMASGNESAVFNGNDDIWCLLIAGSNTWMNYRHQADVAHAYHLLTNNGIPEERIVSMMYDDIAHNPSNPLPGTLYNRPGGPNVYEGLKIDYKGADVNADNFLAVMSGKKAQMAGKGTGRVIESSSSSNVFVFYADHGGVGILGMPSGRLLTNTELTATLQRMKTENRFDKLVMYIEACEAGSMLSSVSQHIQVYGVTASDPTEPSWAAYCSGWKGLPCLGDAFSVQWMDDTEGHNPVHYSLESQFVDVQRRVHSSHVSQYGTLAYTAEAIAQFQGVGVSSSPRKNSSHTSLSASSVMRSELWRVQDVPAMFYKRQMAAATNDNKAQWYGKVQTLQKKRAYLHGLIQSIVSSLESDEKEIERVLSAKTVLWRERECHDVVIRHLDEHCVRFSQNPRAFHYSSSFANLCAKHPAHNIIAVLDDKCANIEYQDIE